MAERKIFAGTRLRRLRARLGLTQSQMAAEIGVSPSYLNLIERNQRPLTVQVLLKLSSNYGVDVGELSGDDRAGAVDALKEVFADPLLAGEIASPTELTEFVEAAPNAARGALRLFEAYREALERLSDLSQRMAHAGEAPLSPSTRLPAARAAEYFEVAGPYFPELEQAAEAFAAELSPRDDPMEALRRHLTGTLKVELRILPAHVMPVEQLRYDRHTLRLFVSERVPLIERPFLLARQIAFLAHRELLERLTETASLGDPEASRICRNGFARRLGEAMLAPASRLASAARDSGFDIALLSHRFMLRPSRVMARLTTLGADPGSGLPPAFLLMLDSAGATLMRIPGAGFPFPRRAPFCARLPLFDIGRPGAVERSELELPDGSLFRTMCVSEEGAWSGTLPPARRLALIGWRTAEQAAAGGAAARPIGVTCRLCERLDCAHRIEQPVTQPGGYFDHVVGPSDHEVTG